MEVGGMRSSPPGDGYPSRRVSIGLTRGGEMHVSLPGKPDEPIDETTLEALRSIGEAALNRMLDEDAGDDRTPLTTPQGSLRGGPSRAVTEPTITAEQMLSIVGLSSAQAFEMCAMVGHDLGKSASGCLCERLRPEYARVEHSFSGGGADCLICGEGRCYYLHDEDDRGYAV